MDKNKKILTILIILTIVFTAIGSSLAYLSWVTSEEQKTQVTFTTTAGFSCSADMGGTIKSGDARILPTTVSETTRGNYIKRELVVNPVITVDDKTIYMDLWLDINSLGTALSNSTNFKYALTTSSNSPTTGVVSSGNFSSKNSGDKVYFLIAKEYSATATETYYLWIWLDAAETNVETAGQSFAFSLNGNCTDYPQPSKPDIKDGMIPVVISSNGITSTISENDSSWYNYNNQEWANMVLVSNSSRSTYQNTSGVVVNENDILAYYVWIPRYKYKIWTTSTSSNGSEQEIEIIFESKDANKSTGTQIGEYITHPAFTFGNTEVNGIWVGKFETGGTATKPLVKPNIKTLRTQNVSQQFTTSQIFGTSTYGMTSNVDAHMMKNSEWGAVAYLSHSRYGVNREIYINNSSGYYTGRSGGNVGGSTAINTVYTSQTGTDQYNTYGFYTWDGYLLEYNTNTKSSTHDINKVASTTGNITGVYDMSGGAWEHAMGILADNNGFPRSGKSTSLNSGYNGVIYDDGNNTQYTDGVNFPDAKYYDLYTSTNVLTACNGGICYGHALSETNGWYRDYTGFVATSSPWITYGGQRSNGANAGAFSFNNSSGASSSSARSVLLLVS